MSKKRLVTIPTPILPDWPCPDCGRIAWARYPLIDGKEMICAHCFPVRSWSPISDAEYRAAIHHSALWHKIHDRGEKAA